MVLDASALLALLYGEPGEGRIRERLRENEAVLSAVNYSEVAAKLAEGPAAGNDSGEGGAGGGGFDAGEIRELVGALAVEVRSFDEEAALAAGMLRPGTRDRGLSSGDRACVAYARQIGGVALTVDGAWKGLEGVEVIER